MSHFRIHSKLTRSELSLNNINYKSFSNQILISLEERSLKNKIVFGE